MLSAAIIFKKQDTEQQISHKISLICEVLPSLSFLHTLVKLCTCIAGNLVHHAILISFTYPDIPLYDSGYFLRVSQWYLATCTNVIEWIAL